MQNQTDLYEPQTYTAIDFVIGLFITLGASLANALGLNVTKLDYLRQEEKPPSERRPDWQRPYWILGNVLYAGSQIIGSTLALSFLRAEYVAPLGSSSLIFNVVLARLLIGTPIERLDIVGTLVTVLGVVGVVVFGNMRNDSDFDTESNLSLTVLKTIWARKEWVAYLTCLEISTAFAFWFSTITHSVCMARVTDERGEAERGERDIDDMVDGGGGRRGNLEGASFMTKVKVWRHDFRRKHGRVRKFVRGYIEAWSQSRPDSSIRKLAGMCWSITGGMLAGQTLILAKSGVKLVTSAINKSDPNEANQFTSPLSWVIVIMLVVAAVTQIYCLNVALKCSDSTLVVPTLFAVYTISGFLNSLVYLDQLDDYKLWVFLLVWGSIAVLCAGVIMLSMKKPPPGKPRSSSISRGGGDGEGDDNALEMGIAGGSKIMTTTTSMTPDDPTTPQGKASQWLSQAFGGRPRPGGGIPVSPSAIGRGEDARGEQNRRARRRGAQKLANEDDDDDDDDDGGDSVLDGGKVKSGPAELEMDEVDELDFVNDGEGKIRRRDGGFDAAAVGEEDFDDQDDDDDDVFGDFEDATEERTRSRSRDRDRDDEDENERRR